MLWGKPLVVTGVAAVVVNMCSCSLRSLRHYVLLPVDGMTALHQCAVAATDCAHMADTPLSCDVGDHCSVLLVVYYEYHATGMGHSSIVLGQIMCEHTFLVSYVSQADDDKRAVPGVDAANNL